MKRENADTTHALHLREEHRERMADHTTVEHLAQHTVRAQRMACTLLSAIQNDRKG